MLSNDSNDSIALAYEVPLNANSKARYVIFNNRRKLQVETEGPAGKTQYTIDFLAFNPKSLEHRVKPSMQTQQRMPVFIAAAVALAALAAALLLSAAVAGFALLIAVLAAAAAIYFRRKNTAAGAQQKKQIFVSRSAKVPLVQIGFQQRSRNLEMFVDLLEKRVTEALAASRLEEKDLLAGELRALRKLMEKGALNKHVYDKAKKYLLAQSS